LLRAGSAHRLACHQKRVERLVVRLRQPAREIFAVTSGMAAIAIADRGKIPSTSDQICREGLREGTAMAAIAGRHISASHSSP
jgi:hypothetical protein